jgi:hypothetical protein
MSESADFDPGPWRGHDFKTARAVYDVHAGRSYTDAVAKGKDPLSLVPDSVETDSEAPLSILCDVTGSMGDFPATIFSKLGYVDIEGKSYLGPDMKTSFGAIGDVTNDEYPLQVRNFVTGKDMEKELKELVIEGKGGGTAQESYDMAMLYYARNVRMPNAKIKPIFIMIGDEGFYAVTKKEYSKFFKGTLQGDVPIQQVADELKSKFSVYLIRKHYHTGDASIQSAWEGLLGKDHIVELPDASRVVDVIFGILAKETGKVDYFKKELAERQDEDQVKTVMTSLKSIKLLEDGDKGRKPAKSMKALPGGSMTRRGKGESVKNSKPLM